VDSAGESTTAETESPFAPTPSEELESPAPVAAADEAVEKIAAKEPAAPVAAVEDKVGPYDKTLERPAATREPPAVASPAPKKDADSEVSGDWHVARLDAAGFRAAPDSPKIELPPFATDVSVPASTTLRSSPVTTASSPPFDPDDLIGSHAPATTISPRPVFEPFHDSAPEAAPAETSPTFPAAAPEREAAHSQVKTVESPMRPIDTDAKTEERPAARAMVPLGGALDDDDSFFRRDDSAVMKEPSGLYRREDSALFDKELSGGLRGKAPKWIAVSLGAAVLVAGGLFLAFKGDGGKKPDNPALVPGGAVARAEERRGEDLESGSARRVREAESRETEAREGDAREDVARRDEAAEARREEGERAAGVREERARGDEARREVVERARDESEVEAPARRGEERRGEARTAEARREEPRREVARRELARREEVARPEESATRRVEVRARAAEPEPRRERRVARAAARAAARDERREEARREARQESDVDRLLKEGKKLVARGRYKKAVEPLEKVVAAKPTAEAHYLLGEAYFELSKEGRALEQLEKATAMGSRRGKAFIMLGSLYSSAGKKAKARGAFEQYLRVDPRGKFAADAKAMLGQN
jgi:tetratricopeptide (TPR) repeat protein